MNVKADTIAVAAHFFLKLQLFDTTRALSVNRRLSKEMITHFFGFWGSSGPSQSTMAFLLRWVIYILQSGPVEFGVEKLP
ncbi:hypothetical protein A0H81_01636 [Grifola frondosa]|uniref:Uncharacterized protein n=1 Tax=Grifola frondosa TaxID=5627 RepID=A0A1C7MN74_GRIFR|nr:hypothetical protein A0H81_01636 [Grifola frondosa]